MRIGSGELDRRISILRAEPIDDGIRTKPGPLVIIGQRWARKLDVSDAERARAGERAQTVTTRFLVRADPLTRTITGKDVVRHRRHGRTLDFEVVGTKDSRERDDGIEISAIARPDKVQT